uniref:non-specific serine/threonine protein kinase n=1 Tax=Oryza glumipatula TaxID=40148 RepID=A0A0E0AL85_9ORYZ
MAPPSKRKICSSFSFLILSIFHLYTSTSALTDTISRVQSLSGSTTVVSKEGNFELGFFSPGNTGNLYVGIWFRTTSKKAVIWVANRDNPVTSATSPELKISEDGNLVLLNKFGEPKWSSNGTWNKPRKSIVAVLLDNGNLILRDQGNSSDVIWQSFDHPTDTILSGQRFGINKITGEYQDRVSWKDPEDPAPGPFSNHVDLIRLNQYVSLWNQSKVYWQSGNWTGQAFTSIPGMPLNTEYNYVFINNSHQLKFIYTTKDVSIITRIVLTVNGQLQCHTWSNKSEEWIVQWSLPAALCDVYSVCGPFGVCKTGFDEKCYCLPGFRPVSSRSWDLGAWNQGCVRKTDISCVDSNKHNGQQEKHAFLKIANIKVPGNPMQLNVQSEEECRSICLNNCICTAYAHQHECIVWNSELRDLKQLSDGNVDAIDIYVRLAASDLQVQYNEHKTHHMRLIAVLGSTFVALCAFGAIIWTFRKRNATQKAFSNDDSLILYSYSFLQHCTKNFSDKLGQENVLVDADFSPKVADFGLAKLMDRNFSRALTTMRGSLPITSKADVYSYGMMLFEIISGKRNTELMESKTIKYFPVWAAVRISNGDISEVFDHRMHDTNVQELERACKVACWCIQDNEAHRPTMQQIVHILQGTRDVVLPSIPAFLQNLVEEYDPASYS